MNCPEVTELLSPFIDDELDKVQTAAIKAHLIRCESCRKERDKHERMGTALRGLPPVTVPRGFEFDLYARLRDSTSHRILPQRPKWTRIAVPFAAMISGIFLGSAFIPSWLAPIPIIADTSAELSNLTSHPYQVVMDNGDVIEYTIENFSPIKPQSDVSNSEPELTLATGTTIVPRPHAERYVLDPMPIRASYERIVY